MHGLSVPDAASQLIRLGQQAAELFRGIKPGQIIAARIVRATSEGYIVNFRGRNFSLPTTSPFEKGQEVRAELVEHDGDSHLRLIPADTKSTPVASDRDVPADQRVIALLARLGLEATAENALAANELILAGLPASRELLESLSLLLSGKTALDAQLVKLTQLLRDILHRVSNPDISDPLREILSVLDNALEAPMEQDLAARLRSFIADSGIFAESKIRMLLKSGTTPEAREQIAGDLKFALLRLKALLATKSQQLRQASAGGRLRELELYLGNALKLIRGQQVHNLIRMGFNELLFHIPFLHDWGLENVRVRFFYERETPQSKGSRSFAIAIEMNTSNLGELRVVPRLYGEKVDCHFEAEHESVAKLIRAESPELRERLETLRLTVGRVTCSVGKPEETFPSGEPLGAPFSRTVDLKV